MKLSLSPREFPLSIEDVRRLDETLRTRWGVDLIGTDLDLESYLIEHADPDVKDLASNALAAARRSLAKGGSEVAFYDAMSDRRLVGIATSVRRALLLDSIAFVAALIKNAAIEGPILDVGCHAGIAMDVLHDVTLNKFYGIDPVQSAITLAQEFTVGRDRLSFKCGLLSASSSMQYELIYCIDSMPAGRNARGIFLRGIRDRLAQNGLAFIVSQHWIAEPYREIRDQLKNLGFGFVHADVVGGWGGMPNQYSAEGCVLLKKGGGASFPSAIKEQVEEQWPAFAEYANAQTTQLREKTQAFFRASGSG